MNDFKCYVFIGIYFLSLGYSVRGVFQLFSEKERSKVLQRFVFLAGLLSTITLFFDPMYLHDIKDKFDCILFAIPIYVLLLAFFVGNPLGRLGLLHKILFGLVLICFSIFFQVFYFCNTSIIHIIFSFIYLVYMWSLGNILSVIVNGSKRVDA